MIRRYLQRRRARKERAEYLASRSALWHVATWGRG